jgi:DMSO/TMAO reductase YedYZ molybdopterin-dependent catalytic subunit
MACHCNLGTMRILCLFLGVLWCQVSLASGSDSISIIGGVEHPQSVSLAALKREPATTETVSLMTERGVLAARYTGVLLWTLLQEAVIKATPGVKNDILRHTVVVTGRDGYTIVLSVGEIDPKFGGDRAMIAYAKDGKPLSKDRGFARLIVPTDKSAGRAVFGIASITIR